jgi:hypothetical protein
VRVGGEFRHPRTLLGLVQVPGGQEHGCMIAGRRLPTVQKRTGCSKFNRRTLCPLVSTSYATGFEPVTGFTLEHLYKPGALARVDFLNRMPSQRSRAFRARRTGTLDGWMHWPLLLPSGSGPNRGEFCVAPRLVTAPSGESPRPVSIHREIGDPMRVKCL